MQKSQLDCRNIVVVGASAGGIEALIAIVSRLPDDLQAAVFVVVHTSPDSPGYLAGILDRNGPLDCAFATDRDVFTNSRIYVAPPDLHLMLDPGRVLRTVRGPRENRSRPAIDPLFRSAALAYGPRVIGVVLSGGLDDGAAGLRGIKMLGGLAIVQEPDDALAGAMPRNAMRAVAVDFCKPAREIGELIGNLVQQKVDDGHRPTGEIMDEKLGIEVAAARGELHPHGVAALGTPSMFTCPECHGTLIEVESNQPVRFRCHTGHAYTADSLLADLTKATEESVWGTVRCLQETSMLLTHLSELVADTSMAEDLRRRSTAAQERAESVRKLGMQNEAENRAVAI